MGERESMLGIAAMSVNTRSADFSPRGQRTTTDAG